MKLSSNVVYFKIDKYNVIGNTFNGSIIGLSECGERLVKKIQKENTIDIEALNSEEKELFNALINQKYFEENNSVLDSVYFHVNNDCNLHCLGCYSHDNNRNKNNNLSFDECCKIIDTLVNVGVRSFVISGGEPFLRNDIDDIIEYIKSKKDILSLQVISNGTIDYKKHIEIIKKYVDEINISIDGYDEKNPQFIRDKGIFNVVIGSIKYLKESNVNTKMIATVHKKNIEYMGKYLKLSEKLNVPISFSLLTVAGDFKEFDKWIATPEQLSKLGAGEIAELNKTSKEISPEDFLFSCRKNCGSGERIISVANNGDVYPCHMLHDNKYKLGNILKEDIENILTDGKEFSNKYCVDNISNCKNCEYKYLCGGGCRANLLNDLQINYKGDCDLSKMYYHNLYESIKNSL